jgi:hypothetical protein
MRSTAIAAGGRPEERAKIVSWCSIIVHAKDRISRMRGNSVLIYLLFTLPTALPNIVPSGRSPVDLSRSFSPAHAATLPLRR